MPFPFGQVSSLCQWLGFPGKGWVWGRVADAYIYILLFFFSKRPKTKSNSPHTVTGGMESPRHGSGACPWATKLTRLGWPAPSRPWLCCGSVTPAARTKDKAHLGQKAGGKHMTRALLSTSCPRGLGVLQLQGWASFYLPHPYGKGRAGASLDALRAW